jgi:hypothetical protein
MHPLIAEINAMALAFKTNGSIAIDSYISVSNAIQTIYDEWAVANPNRPRTPHLCWFDNYLHTPQAALGTSPYTILTQIAERIN